MAVMTAAADVTRPACDAQAKAFKVAGLDILVTSSRAHIDPLWQALEEFETAAIFQSRSFLCAWLQTAAQRCGETPVYVVASRDQQPLFLLPLAVSRKLGARVLKWGGQAHANYGMGMFHPDVLAEFARGEHDIDDLIRQIARAVGADIVHLQNQPATWAGHLNPFAQSLRAMRSANDTFVLHLDDDFQAQYKRLFSSRTLSNLKRKQRKLEEMGQTVFARPREVAVRENVLGWFFETKTMQLAQGGRASPFAVPCIQDLYRNLARDTARLDIDALSVGQTRVAMGMTARAGRTAYLLNSVHQGEEFARSSPGTLLLHRMVAQAHAAGARVYDFGPGELPYKLEWEPQRVPLFFTTHLINPLHVATYAALVFIGLGKARAKRSPRLREWVRRVRLARARLTLEAMA